jgi:hypothetical protein
MMDNTDDKNTDEPLQFEPLPGLTLPVRKVVHNTCGDCTYFNQVGKDIQQGSCHFQPPSVAFTDRGPVNVRPGIRTNELACHQFKRNEYTTEASS